MTPVPVADPVLTARIYQETRERISELVTGLDDAALNTAVAACPGWWVRDVVAHVAAVADDWAEGRCLDRRLTRRRQRRSPGSTAMT